LRYRGRRAVDEELTEGALDVLLDIERESTYMDISQHQQALNSAGCFAGLVLCIT
jgi:hypothetical protein